MKNKIILSLLTLLIVAGAGYSQISAGKFSLKNIDSYWESSIPASSFWIPKNRPFGTSFYWGDSTGYVVFSKGIYLQDSLKVAKDLYVGVKGGKIYLDTNRRGTIEYSGNSLYFTSSKSNGNMTFDNTVSSSNSGFSFYLSEGTPTFTIFKYRNGQVTTALTYDTLNGLYVQKGDIYVSSTAQIKIPKDTVSDYTNADAVTLNRQQGVVTTKSLTTASGSDYTITVNNSLVSSSTNVWAMIKTNPGTEVGAPIIRQCTTGSGTITIIIRNLGSNSLNSAISFQFIVFN